VNEKTIWLTAINTKASCNQTGRVKLDHHQKQTGGRTRKRGYAEDSANWAGEDTKGGSSSGPRELHGEGRENRSALLKRKRKGGREGE